MTMTTNEGKNGRWRTHFGGENENDDETGTFDE